MTAEEITIMFNDLEDCRQTLQACLTYFTAQDVQDAQKDFGSIQKSAMTFELERVKARLDGYVGDYLLAKHEEEMEDLLDEEGDYIEPEDREEGDPEPEAEEEPLSMKPMGSFERPKQEGREITKEELAQRKEDEYEDEDAEA